MDPVLITDTSVLLNLLATGQAERILRGGPWRFQVCPAVLAEARMLRHRETREEREVDCRPLVEAGLLAVVEPETDEELELLVDYTGLLGRGSDGEAMALALAESRGAAVAIDDERAVRRARQRWAGLVVVTTPAILRAWQVAAGVGHGEMRTILGLVRDWACYAPGASHPDAEWWHGMAR